MSGRTWMLLGADGLPCESDTPGALGGNVRNPGDRVYGRLDCGAGFRPCGTCLKPAYATWRGSLVGRA